MSEENYGEDNLVDALTSRGRDWPCLQQFVVFLENKVGSLHQLLRTVERDDLMIVGLSIQDSADSSTARVITNSYERTREILELSGLPFCESEVIGVLLPDVAEPLTNVCGSLMSAELNVHYVYPLLYRRNGRGAVAIFVDDLDESLRVLKERNHDFVTEDDLLEYDGLYE